MSRKQAERRRAIIELLQADREMKVSKLAEELKVSTETVRCDLDFLAEQGQVVKFHGKACLPRLMKELPLKIRQDENLAVKKAVMRKAVDFIEDGMTVYLDPGSTILAGMDFLRAKKNLTIVVNSTEVAMKAVELKCRVILLGGRMDEDGLRTTGYFAEEMVDKIQIDLAVFGTCGVMPNAGFGIYWDEEIGLRRKILSAAGKSIVVMDRSKLSTPVNFMFASFEEADALVCERLDEKERALLGRVKRLIETD
ncbi:MAG: DeoR/GlpR transcriptional regulator [Erysipelotrichaceae bacterium]|nr:DeoR/GlpR transcriptional regulator [Erysipelotrichaceae bacterium]